MGRNAIYLVIGFTFVFLMSGRNLSTVTTEAFKNAIDYYESSVGHNVAQAGANFACNQIFLAPNWRTGFAGVAFAGGTFSVTAVGIPNTDRVQIVSAGIFDGDTTKIKILLQPSLFSKFAYYSDNEPSTISWTTGDTVWGPYHSNTKLYVDGNPVFNGKATSLNGIKKAHTSDKPEFNKGFESGISITMPSDLNTLKAKAQQSGGGGFYQNFTTATDVYMNFNANGTVTYKIGTGTWITTNLATFAGSNKVIMIEGGNLRIKGTLSGQVTIAALGPSGSTTKGGVFIDSSIAYSHDPLTGTSTDMMGIVATNDIMITDNTYNNSAAGVTIQAAMFSLAGGFGSENYDTRQVHSPATSMSIKLLGGVSQHIRRAVGTIGSPGTGFKKSYKYDERMLVAAPPCYPTTGSYEILEWLE